MPATTANNVPIKYGWTAKESGWSADMNKNLELLSVLVQCRVLDRDLTAPPASPALQSAYIPKASATGAWVGQENKLAIYLATGWEFLTPKEGWLVYMDDEDVYYRWDGTSWGIFNGSGGGGGSSTLVVQNLSGAANTVLATHAGALLRVSHTAATTLTVPDNATTPFSVGTVVHLRQTGVGQLTVAAAAGVTINTAETLKARKQGSSLSLVKVGTDEWDITGDLEAL